ARQCALPLYADALVCSNEALAHVLRQIGFGAIGNMLGYAAILALPSVILVLLFAQTRIFFVMSRDGLLPEGLSKVHPKWRTPYVVTAITGVIVAIAAAFFPVGQLADIANAGTLYAFLMVAVAVMVLRRTDPTRKRTFRVPGLIIIGPLTILGCLFLFLNLPSAAMLVLPVWTAIGLVVYFAYSRRNSHLGRGIVEVVDDIGGQEHDFPIDTPDSHR
ncbi:MAG: APC family permease, partial [Tsuneonella troitsensis]